MRGTAWFQVSTCYSRVSTVDFKIVDHRHLLFNKCRPIPLILPRIYPDSTIGGGRLMHRLTPRLHNQYTSASVIAVHPKSNGVRLLVASRNHPQLQSVFSSIIGIIHIMDSPTSHPIV